MDLQALTEILGADPMPWLLDSPEPSARWIALSRILGRPSDDPETVRARSEVLADEGVRRLVDELPDWDTTVPSGHHSPQFLPNRLNLLADMGVTAGDFDRIDTLLEAMAARQDPGGRFQALGATSARPKPEWGSLLCDTNAITDVLARYGLVQDRRVQAALRRIQKDRAKTPQGLAWQCIPNQQTLFRGPGRKMDVCPQVTLEGLRALSHLPADEQPPWILEAARTPLEVWRRRTEERPYQFGHGYGFKSVKWPNFWYDVLWVLETVTRFPQLWRGPDALPEDRASVAELAACLVAYNVDADGRVTPRRVYRGFEGFSFGRKSGPSPFATAKVAAALVPLLDLAEEIRAVDVEALPSSKGGTGIVVPPQRLLPRPEPPLACPVPRRIRTFDVRAATARVLRRQHLTAQWEGASVESTVADIVGIQALHPFGPNAALLARMPRFTHEMLESALYDRRSLALHRCMRGILFVVRREMLPVVHAATNDKVARAARKHATWRGITEADYKRLVPAVLDALSERPTSIEELRERLRPDTDIAALVTRMAAEGLLVRDRPAGGWLDRKPTWAPFSQVFPDIELDSMRVDVAQETLVRAYIRAFGPVTQRDVSWWTGIGAPSAKRAVDRLGDEIELVRLSGAAEDEDYLMHAADVDELDVAHLERPSVVLLPSRDPFVMGYALKGRFVSDPHRQYVFDPSGCATSVVFVDGRAAGVWDLSIDPSPTASIYLFDPQPDSVVQLIEKRATALGILRFGERVRIEWRSSMVPLTDRPPNSVVKPLR